MTDGKRYSIYARFSSASQYVRQEITRRKMVASRKDLADAIQSYSDNDNHPEKMGNRQQRTNLADVAAFPRCSGCKDTIKT